MAPSGYSKVNLNSPSIDLKNKQIYLTQVPADFDSRKAEFKSETEISCDGTTYFVNTSASVANCNVLTPSKDGKLIPSETKLAGLLALTKKVPLPKVNYEEVITTKPPVPQIPNLRMRHFPTGYGPKSFNIDESKPKSSGQRRKHSADKEGKAGAEEIPRKKHKKDKDSEADSKKKKKSHKHKSGKSDK